MKHQKTFGSWGEKRAGMFPENQGLELSDVNIRNPFKKIDCIFRDRSATVCVEVRTRSSLMMGQSEDPRSTRKNYHNLSTTNAYLEEHEEVYDCWCADEISIVNKSTPNCEEIEWLIDAIH